MNFYDLNRVVTWNAATKAKRAHLRDAFGAAAWPGGLQRFLWLEIYLKVRSDEDGVVGFTTAERNYVETLAPGLLAL